MMPLKLPEPRMFAARAMKKRAEERSKDARQMEVADQGVLPLTPASSAPFISAN